MRRILVTVAAFLPLIAASAQTPAKQTPPPPGPVRPFEFPKWETKKLANGLTVFVIEDHRVPVVAYRLEIAGAGAASAEPKKAGLASLTADLLTEGTKTRTAQQVAAAIDRVGGQLITDANPDSASARTTVSKSAAPVALELLADVVQNPTFPQEELTRRVTRALSALQIQYNDPQSLARVTAGRVAFGDHPYGAPTEGTPDTVRNLKREDVTAFYSKHYGPANAYLAIAGDVTPAEAFAAVEKAFGSWKSSAARASIATAKPAQGRRVVVVDKPDAVQTQFGLVALAIPRNHPDYIPLLIANQIFGGSFNSRLNMKLRAAEGLTYGASSNFGTLVHAGSFNVGSFTRTEKTGTAIKMMNDLVRELVENPITDQELNEAKAYLAGSFVISVETPDAVAARVLTSALNNLPPDYWQKYRDAIQATSKDQVVAAVKRHVNPANMNIVAVGNASGFVKELEPYGKVQVIPAGDLDIVAANMMRAKEAAPVSAETKAKGAQYVSQAVEAMGGRAALDALKSMTSKGTMTISMGGQSMKAETEELIVFPDKYRMTITMPMGQVVQAFDGKTAWMQQGPQSRELPPAASKEMAVGIARASAVGLLRAVLEGKAEISAMDTAEVDGKKLNVAMWTQGDASVKLMFDPETRRVVRMAYRGTGMMGAADFEVVYGDYRKVGDVFLPFSETIYQNGQKFAERVVTDRNVNVEAKPDVFTKPAA